MPRTRPRRPEADVTASLFRPRSRATPHPLAGVDPATNTPLTGRPLPSHPTPKRPDPATEDTNRRRRARLREAVAAWWPDIPKSALRDLDRATRNGGQTAEAVIAQLVADRTPPIRTRRPPPRQQRGGFHTDHVITDEMR